MDEIITKRCSKCGTLKSRGDFNIRRASRDGLCPICKACKMMMDAAYRDSHRKEAKEWRDGHKDITKEYNKKYHAEYYQNNKVEVLRKTAEYARKHRDICNSINKKYRDRLPHAVKQARWSYHRGRRRKAEGHYTPEEWIYLCNKYDNKCLCCGDKKPLTVDHVVPLIKGGTNNIDNIQPLCRGCNARKNTKIIDYRSLRP